MIMWVAISWVMHMYVQYVECGWQLSAQWLLLRYAEILHGQAFAKINVIHEVMMMFWASLIITVAVVFQLLHVYLVCFFF